MVVDPQPQLLHTHTRLGSRARVQSVLRRCYCMLYVLASSRKHVTHLSACVVHEVIQRTQSVASPFRGCVAGPEATPQHLPFVNEMWCPL